MYEQLNCELEYALKQEAYWRKVIAKTNSGSYCENPGNDFKTIQPILAAYKALSDALLTYERSGLNLTE